MLEWVGVPIGLTNHGHNGNLWARGGKLSWARKVGMAVVQRALPAVQEGGADGQLMGYYQGHICMTALICNAHSKQIHGNRKQTCGCQGLRGKGNGERLLVRTGFFSGWWKCSAARVVVAAQPVKKLKPSKGCILHFMNMHSRNCYKKNTQQKTTTKSPTSC